MQEGEGLPFLLQEPAGPEPRLWGQGGHPFRSIPRGDVGPGSEAGRGGRALSGWAELYTVGCIVALKGEEVVQGMLICALVSAPLSLILLLERN